MAETLEEKDWDTLLSVIDAGRCTPFLGAGACVGALPLGSEVARNWATKYGYPLEDCDDLVRVAQFLAVDRYPMFPKDEIVKLFRSLALPDFNKPDEPHGVLADLPFSVYMTTNYDDIMMLALKNRNRDPKRELCHWNQDLKYEPSIFDTGFKPSVANPVVFHLHGHHQLTESLVLTEDDYLDFLLNNSKDVYILPHWIQRALSRTSLLFIGYRLVDWSFRVLFRGFVTSRERSLGRMSITVQLPFPQLVDEVHLKNGDKITGRVHKQSEKNIDIETKAMGLVSISKECVDRIVAGEAARSEAQRKQQEYLSNYFKKMDMRVYWGEAKDFARELRKRWETYKEENLKNDI
jgi:hypothetical protein